MGLMSLLPLLGRLIPDRDAQDQRDASYSGQVQEAFSKEFRDANRTWFDSLIDGLNRLPRPLMAFGVIGLFTMAMVDPLWFAARMQGLVLVPEDLWILFYAIVGFFFGARELDKRRTKIDVMAKVPQVIENLRILKELRSDSPGAADTDGDSELALNSTAPTDNPALEDWRSARAR